MEHPLADSFALHDEAQSLVRRVQLYPELSHTVGARILCVASQPTPMRRGDPCVAFLAEPTMQSPLRNLWEWLLADFGRPVLAGECPEWIVTIDAALWPTLAPLERERLVYHELKRLKPRENHETGDMRLHRDGRPQLRLAHHDVETSEDEARRYGAAVAGLEGLVHAIVEGEARLKARRRRTA